VRIGGPSRDFARVDRSDIVRHCERVQVVPDEHRYRSLRPRRQPPESTPRAVRVYPPTTATAGPAADSAWDRPASRCVPRHQVAFPGCAGGSRGPACAGYGNGCIAILGFGPARRLSGEILNCIDEGSASGPRRPSRSISTVLCPANIDLVTALDRAPLPRLPASGVLAIRPGQTSVGCGTWNPARWVAAGAALLVTGALARLLRRR
jgi:hypothetical protein